VKKDKWIFIDTERPVEKNFGDVKQSSDSDYDEEEPQFLK